MTVRFESSRERLDRAREHWAAFQNRWKLAVKDGTYRVAVDVEDDGTGTVSVALVRELPVELSLELGESLYQLRAALDACVYQAAVIDSGKNPPPDETSLEFPICASVTNWQGSARKIAPLTAGHRRIIEDMQPCHIEKFPGTARVIRSLAILNDWARKDRHRRLHLMRSIVSKVSQPLIATDAPYRITAFAPRFGHYLERDPVVATFTLDGWVPDTKLKPNPRVVIEVAVDEPPAREGDRDTLDDRMRAMFFAVAFVREAFEESFAPPYPLGKVRGPYVS